MPGNNDGYKVGYRRPPKETQFKKGESGNPKGRRKHTKNFKTDLTEELNEKVTVREGERTVKISKQRALLKSMFSRALVKGDTRAMNLAFSLYLRLLDPASEADELRPLNSDDREVLAAFRQEAIDDAAAKKKRRKKTTGKR